MEAGGCRNSYPGAVCNARCLTRGAVAWLTTRIASDLPEAVTRDSVEHTWPSYRDAVMALLDGNPVPAAIERPLRPTLVVVEDADAQTPAEDVLNWPHDDVRVEVWTSDHLLPLRHAERFTDLVVAEVTARGDGG